MKVTNISPHGDRLISGFGYIAAGETAEVPDELARELLKQSLHFVFASTPNATKADKAEADNPRKD